MSQTALKQISANYDPEQDRILLRISTSDESEMRFWLTRRYVILLQPILDKMIAKLFLDQTEAATPANDRKAVAAYHQEKASQNTDFTTEYEPGSSFPLGETPILLSRINVRPDDHQAAQILCMHPLQGQGIDLNMNGDLANALKGVLESAIAKTEWGIAKTEIEELTSGEGESPQLLH